LKKALALRTGLAKAILILLLKALRGLLPVLHLIKKYLFLEMAAALQMPSIWQQNLSTDFRLNVLRLRQWLLQPTLL
jgi:hypothetical protein